jgi:hypothetical protein
MFGENSRHSLYAAKHSSVYHNRTLEVGSAFNTTAFILLINYKNKISNFGHESLRIKKHFCYQIEADRKLKVKLNGSTLMNTLESIKYLCNILYDRVSNMLYLIYP